MKTSLIRAIASQWLFRTAKEEKHEEIVLPKGDAKLLDKIWSGFSKTKKLAADEKNPTETPEFQEFWKLKYDGGRKKLPNTNVKTKDRFPQVSASTLMFNVSFRNRVLKEFHQWSKKDEKEAPKVEKGSSLFPENRYKDVKFNLPKGGQELLDKYKLSVHDLADMVGIGHLPPGPKEIDIKIFREVLTIEAGGKSTGWEIKRTVRPAKKTISNDCIVLPKDSPPGTGTKLFASQVQTARAKGYTSISCDTWTDPPEWVGGLVWPKLGYDAELPEEVETEAYKLLEKNGFHSPFKISHLLMCGEEGQKIWKDNVPQEMFGLKFDLSENSNSSKVLKAYLKAKGIQ